MLNISCWLDFSFVQKETKDFFSQLIETSSSPAFLAALIIASCLTDFFPSMLSGKGTDKVGGAIRTKKVTFARGSAPPREALLAVSISTHETTAKYVEYCIDVWQDGFHWISRKRYSDFEALNKNLISEMGGSFPSLPHLPQKRWFESKRWLNRLVLKFLNTQLSPLSKILTL